MNAAESMIRTLANCGLKVCFTNPGTTEMHLVAALKSTPAIKTVLGLFEGVCSGAADGYGRMTGWPAATLLHLGPGLANSMANLHNARRARTPIVNLIGEHASYHVKNDPPLASDIATLATPVSAWVHTADSAINLAADGAKAISESLSGHGQIATLIVPADIAWGDAGGPTQAIAPPKPKPVSDQAVETAAVAIETKSPAALFLGGGALNEEGLLIAARIAQKTGIQLMCPTFVGRLPRGAGRPLIKRLPYFPERAQKRLSGLSHLILAGATTPQAFFAYPGRSVELPPKGCIVNAMASPEQDVLEGLQMLAKRLGAERIDVPPTKLKRPQLPRGPLSAEAVGATLGALLPENAIVSDESGTSGYFAYRHTTFAPPHDWLMLTGGSIGQGIPVATGAAVACPDRKVICLQGDGGAMFTLQALWTQAREKLNVTTVLFSNRRYQILGDELKRLQFEDSDKTIDATFDLSRPDLNWVKTAQGMGVDAARAASADDFNRLLSNALAKPGPYLIEVPL
jgi:acetolactate synthase I/II/III large subunit